MRSATAGAFGSSRSARKPQQNALAELFIGRLRDECLNETLFTSLPQARAVLAAWKDDYNLVRPNSGVGHLLPAVYNNLGTPVMRRAWDSPHRRMKKGAQVT